MTLALKYRPARFPELYGQEPSAAVLYLMCKRKSIPSAMLFTGEHGCGKTSTARIVGMALNCEELPGPATEWPCGVCPSCKAVATSISPDVMEVDAASNGGIDNVRSIRQLAQYGTAGEHHLVLLDEAHSMSRAGFDVLLKELEEPHGQTTFVLITTEAGKVPKTVRSRCMQFPFRPISVSVIHARLTFIARAEGIEVEPALLTLLAERSGGAMRDAIMALEQIASVGITSAHMWYELIGETDFAPALLGYAADGQYEPMWTVLDAAVGAAGDPSWVTSQIVSCLRDLLVLSSGGQVPAQGEALAVRQSLAARLGPGPVSAAMRVLWDYQTCIRVEDRASGLVLATREISEKLYTAKPVIIPVSSSNGHHKPGLQDAQAVFGRVLCLCRKCPRPRRRRRSAACRKCLRPRRRRRQRETGTADYGN